MNEENKDEFISENPEETPAPAEETAIPAEDTATPADETVVPAEEPIPETSETTDEIPAETAEEPLADTPAVSAPEEPEEPAPAQEPAAEPIPVTVTVAAPEKPKRSRSGFWLALAIVFLCLALLAGFAAIIKAMNGEPEAPHSSSTVTEIPQNDTPQTTNREDIPAGEKLTVQEIIQKVNPVTVTVQVTIRNTTTGQAGEGFGTGVIFTEDGYMLTNAHVVADATAVSVVLFSGKVYPAEVVGADTDSDVAVIKVDAKGLPTAEFGKSSSLIPGDPVVAIGTPYEKTLANTVTTGIVSALRDKLKFQNLGFTLDVIQHSAPINSGNSGGPLINEYGQVIGINSIKITGAYENLGFALPIDEVLPIAEELIANGKIQRPAIGITGYTYDDTRVSGVYVYSIVKGGPADKAGLRVNDVILEIDGKSVRTIDELKETIQSMKIGDRVTLRYYRNGIVSQTDITLAAVDQ